MATGQRRGSLPHPLACCWNLWALSPRGHVRVFLAEMGDELVSAHLVALFSGVLPSKGFAWPREHRNDRPGRYRGDCPRRMHFAMSAKFPLWQPGGGARA